ncbi:MAG: ribonuclease III [Thermoguttaceae bacterium]|nr:ribonuclease III [Thermoguttaceae bacterium]
MENQRDKIRICQKFIDYQFKDESLLVTALTHSSCAPTHIESNERMEFLGDAVLGLAAAHLLFEQNPHESEGELSVRKSVLVSRKTCFAVAKRLGLDKCLMIGAGIGSVGEIPNSIVANLMEAVIGAIFLDGGFEEANDFISRNFFDQPAVQDEQCDANNFKEALLQYTQKHKPNTPLTYCLLDEKGPCHRKCFKVAVCIGKKMFQAAWGTNKKTAEQRAAENALCVLEGLPAPYVDGD